MEDLKAQMDAAAVIALARLDVLLANPEAKAVEIITWFGEMYMTAGHKRLGRGIAQRAKAVAKASKENGK